MAISTIKVLLLADIQTVWNKVTSLTDYSWRSDLSNIEVLNDKQFIEYTKDGFCTFFTITLEDKYKRWEFDIENNNMKGHWTGVFTDKMGQTEVEFTEDVTTHKIFMKPFIKAYLKKQQNTYINDLKKALKYETF